MEELFSKPINGSIEDMDKFEAKEMKTNDKEEAIFKKHLVWLVS